MKNKLMIIVTIVFVLFFTACEEKQNKINRYIQNWTGVDGVLEVYSNGKIMKRFMRIDKLSTAVATEGGNGRAYRYGYGYLDENFNFKVDNDERKVYFEVSDFSTYIFYENPKSVGKK